MQPEAPRQRGFLQPWPVRATSLWAGPPAVGQLSTGRPRETSAFIAFPVHVAPQPADALNSREVLFPLPQGPGPSNNVFPQGSESAFNLALGQVCTGVAPDAPRPHRWLPERSLLGPAQRPSRLCSPSQLLWKPTNLS